MSAIDGFSRHPVLTLAMPISLAVVVVVGIEGSWAQAAYVLSGMGACAILYGIVAWSPALGMSLVSGLLSLYVFAALLFAQLEPISLTSAIVGTLFVVAGMIGAWGMIGSDAARLFTVVTIDVGLVAGASLSPILGPWTLLWNIVTLLGPLALQHLGVMKPPKILMA